MWRINVATGETRSFEAVAFIALNIVVPICLVVGVGLLWYAAWEFGRIMREQRERE